MKKVLEPGSGPSGKLGHLGCVSKNNFFIYIHSPAYGYMVL